MDKIFISKEEASNKFWGYVRSDTDMTVTAKWGRLGLEGQQKVHPFSRPWELDDFISKKTREKLRDGYGEVTPEQYEVEAAMAKTIGIGQKVDQLLFVEEKGDTITFLDATKLHNPDIKPYVYARLIGILKDGIRPITEFMFTPTESFVIQTHGGTNFVSATAFKGQRTVTNKVRIDVGSPNSAMASAVEEVVGKVLF